MINQITLIGNLGKDPELKRTSSGAEYAVFSLATSENRKVNEQWQSETEWHYIKVWGQQTERVMRQLKKGSKAYVQGKLRSYEVQHGIRVLTELRRLILLSIDEHGQEMHDHSMELLMHIERTLEEVRRRERDDDDR